MDFWSTLEKILVSPTQEPIGVSQDEMDAASSELDGLYHVKLRNDKKLKNKQETKNKNENNKNDKNNENNQNNQNNKNNKK